MHIPMHGLDAPLQPAGKFAQTHFTGAAHGFQHTPALGTDFGEQQFWAGVAEGGLLGAPGPGRLAYAFCAGFEGGLPVWIDSMMAVFIQPSVQLLP